MDRLFWKRWVMLAQAIAAHHLVQVHTHLAHMRLLIVCVWSYSPLFLTRLTPSSHPVNAPLMTCQPINPGTIKESLLPPIPNSFIHWDYIPPPPSSHCWQEALTSAEHKLKELLGSVLFLCFLPFICLSICLVCWMHLCYWSEMMSSCHVVRQ